MRDYEDGRLPKSWSTIALVVVLGIAIGLAASPVAAEQKFIRVDDQDGEADYLGYENWSYLNAYTHIINKPGKVPSCKVIVEKPIDSVSPYLWLAALTGDILGEVVVHFLYPGDPPLPPRFISLMKAVTIKNLKNIGVDDEEVGDITIDRFVLLPESMRLEYIPRREDGSPDAPIISDLNCSD